MKTFLTKSLFLCTLLLSMLNVAGAVECEYETIVVTLSAEDMADAPSLFALPQTGTFDYENPGYGAQLEDPIALAAYNTYLTITPDTPSLLFDLGTYELEDLTQDAANALCAQLSAPLQAALAAFMFDHPEMHYCTPKAEFSFGLNSNDSIHWNITATCSVTQNPASRDMCNEMESLRKNFCNDFDSTLPIIDQYRYIHDYICDLATYNDAVAGCNVPNCSTHEHDAAHSAYGLLVHSIPVVCEGYAKSFKVLCDAVGLPCILVVGESAQNKDHNGKADFTGQTNHMWNAVEVDGKWYAVDTTWDDPVPFTELDDLEISLITYDYFLKNASFTPENEAYDHCASNRIYFANYAPMLFDLPALENATCPGAENCATRTLNILYFGSDLDIPANFGGYIFNDVVLADVPALNITLVRDQEMTSTLKIPEGKTFTLAGSPDCGDGSPTITSNLENFAHYNRPLFDVSGTLNISGIDLDTENIWKLANVKGGHVSVPEYEAKLDYSLNCSASERKSILNWRAYYDTYGRMTRLTSSDLPSTGNYRDLFPTNSGPQTKRLLLNPENLSFFVPSDYDLLFLPEGTLGSSPARPG